MELRTEIEIARAPSAVWSVLLDFSSYRDWNPFIPMISGEARVGATLEVLLAFPSGRELTFRPKSWS
ncbi:MAG TPA: SRPBCC family protein [Polyangiaceae bacterium]